MIVDDVQAAASRLCAGLGIDIYRNTLADDFAAVGDAHGLFILARTGRPWLSTIHAAETHPLRAQINVPDNGNFVVTAPPLQVRRGL
jgi:hypothetical protein